MTLQTENDRVIASIRANIVFEKLIVSVLTVAAISGAAHFVISCVALFAAGALSQGAAAAALMAAIGFTFFFFIAGFGASLAIGIPLFKALEKEKLRRVWPYCLAAFAVGLVVLAAAGAAPSFDAPWRALYLAPGIAAAILFGRKMRPFWRSVEMGETAPAAVVRLH